MIKFHTLDRQLDVLRKDLDKIWNETLKDQRFIGGEPVKQFEQSFADLLKVTNCVSLANGTDALYLSLRALNIGEGDEVITVGNSWISSSEVVSQVGAKVVFADIDEYHTIDIGHVQSLITDKTKAVIAVHLYGQACDMSGLMTLVKKYNLKLIEDCAQAHLTKYRGQNVGTFGDVGTFSFYPGKNLGAFGDAGCVITNNNELALKIKKLSQHGSLKKHEHEFDGVNSRLDTLQARILNLKLGFIEEWNASRNKIADLYTSGLNDLPGVKLIPLRPETYHTQHVFVIRAEKREELVKYLAAEGIETAIHYPRPLTDLPFYKLNIGSIVYRNIDSVKDEILSLPMFPEMKVQEVNLVIKAIRQFYL